MNVLRLSLLAVVGSTLVACGGEKLAANKEAAAQALFAVSSRAQPPSSMASGLTPSVAAQYTQDCTHGGKATLEFSFDDLTGTQTATTSEFDFNVKFDHCNDDGHNSFNGQMTTHWALDATDTMNPTLALTFHGRVDISGEVSDFVDANVTQTVNVVRVRHPLGHRLGPAQRHDHHLVGHVHLRPERVGQLRRRPLRHRASRELTRVASRAAFDAGKPPRAPRRFRLWREPPQRSNPLPPKASPSGPPIRLRITYQNPQSLLGEYARSVGKGAVALVSRKRLPVGTRFVFEMYAGRAGQPVEVFGEVVGVSRSGPDQYVVSVRYDPGADRAGLDRVLTQVLEAHRFEKARQHPRLPLTLRATEEQPYSPSYLLRDLSRGGAGLEVESPELPRQVQSGTPVLLEVSLSLGTLALFGEVAWTFSPPPDRVQWVSPAFGIKFGKLRPETLDRLDRILSLKSLPPPPWKAAISFGMDAVSRLP